MVQEVLMKVGEWRQHEQLDRIFLFYNRLLSGATYRPHTEVLLPIDQEWLRNLAKKSWPSRVLPYFTMDWDQLFSSLVWQYLFISLYQAFAESLASENASRLASMQRAEKNIAERLEELTAYFHQQRQMTITSELLDIVSGFEAMSTPGERPT
jgi:F-type H+-transporting ATPase subunit gamma